MGSVNSRARVGFAVTCALLLGLMGSAATRAATAQTAPAAARPNILVILADDLGFSDLGAFGGEIATPHLDALAREGLRMTDFHTAATCSPTRAMLMSGTDHHRAGLANMGEMLTPAQRGQPGYEGYLSSSVVTLAELLRDAGYRTLMSGKWHLGTRPELDPAQRGFERVFALLQAGHNHFGRERRTAANLGGGARYTEDGRPVEIPPDFYSSDYFTTKLIEFLAEDTSRPFFAYLPFSAPHWPLHAPAETIAKYRDRYDSGWEALYRERVLRQRELGLLPKGAAAALPATLRDWDTLDPEQRRRQARKMEIYAAMVERLDWNVGRVLAALRTSGRLDNTVVVFFSDNGAAPDSIEGFAATVPNFPPTPAGEFTAWGSVDSMLSYGPNWAQASSAPRRLYKSTSAEGGITSPTIVRYPGFAHQGTIARTFATVMDLAPTFLELAGAAHPGTQYRGRTVEPLRGRSMLPFLRGRSARVHAEDEAIGWELFGQRALRQGRWKATYVSAPNGPGRWELFDLARDPGERRDLAVRQPARLARLTALWDDYAREMGVVLAEQVVSPWTAP